MMRGGDAAAPIGSHRCSLMTVQGKVAHYCSAQGTLQTSSALYRVHMMSMCWVEDHLLCILAQQYHLLLKDMFLAKKTKKKSWGEKQSGLQMWCWQPAFLSSLLPWRSARRMGHNSSSRWLATHVLRTLLLFSWTMYLQPSATYLPWDKSLWVQLDNSQQQSLLFSYFLAHYIFAWQLNENEATELLFCSKKLSLETFQLGLSTPSGKKA